jgi:hypothetical protein
MRKSRRLVCCIYVEFYAEMVVVVFNIISSTVVKETEYVDCTLCLYSVDIESLRLESTYPRVAEGLSCCFGHGKHGSTSLYMGVLGPLQKLVQPWPEWPKGLRRL